jgi:hypothetical protein
MKAYFLSQALVSNYITEYHILQCLDSDRHEDIISHCDGATIKKHAIVVGR